MSNRSREKNRFLLDKSHLSLMVPLIFHLLKVYVIEKNLALFRVVEAFKQGNDWAFSTSRGSNKCNNLISFHINIHSLEYLHILFWRIAEFHVFQFEVTILILWYSLFPFPHNMLLWHYDLGTFKARSPDFAYIGKMRVNTHNCECNESLIQQDGCSFSSSDAKRTEEMTHDENDNHSGSLAKERICTEKHCP